MCSQEQIRHECISKDKFAKFLELFLSPRCCKDYEMAEPEETIKIKLLNY